MSAPDVMAVLDSIDPTFWVEIDVSDLDVPVWAAIDDMLSAFWELQLERR